MAFADANEWAGEGKVMKSNHNKRKYLNRGIIFSVVILITFMVFQAYEWKILNLEVKWLILSGIPILLALILGGYLKSFKGFGIELEANLKEPLPLSLISEADAETLPGFLKSEMHKLEELPEKEKRNIKRLTFIYGKKRYYDEYASNAYFQSLKYLRFLEIVSERGEFIYLIPINVVFPDNRNNINLFDSEITHKFIKAIEDESIEIVFKDVIKDYLKISDSLIDAYKKIKLNSQNNITMRNGATKRDEGLPVVNIDNKMIGIIYFSKIESRIAEEVVKNI